MLGRFAGLNEALYAESCGKWDLCSGFSALAAAHTVTLVWGVTAPDHSAM